METDHSLSNTVHRHGETIKDFHVFTAELNNIIPNKIRKYHVPGAAISIFQKGGEQWVKCYGVADKNENRAVEENTCFQVASISKTLTAWGIMRLVEEGKLSLDEPINRYLTRWRLPSSAFDMDGITVRRLLSHTAGVSVHGYTGRGGLEELPSLEESLAGKKCRNTAVKVIKEPGTFFWYSGGGYTLLQLAVEEVTGISFSKYMKDEILEPLGMKDSTYEWNPEIAAGAASAYGILGYRLPNYLYTEKAAAGLYTTITDLTRFLTANIGDIYGALQGGGVLSQKTVELMHSRVYRGIPYGLGYYVRVLPHNSKMILHDGVNRGWASQFILHPHSGEGLAIMTNSDHGGRLIADISRLWIQRVLGEIPECYYRILRLDRMSRVLAFLRGSYVIGSQYIYRKMH